MNILEVHHLHKAYENHIALQDVSLSIPKGSIFGLLGPNGAGKTTLIRIINQIIDRDSGEIFFNNEKLQSKHIPFIGYLPEERGLYKKMQVWDQLIYFARLKGMPLQEAKTKVNYWLDKLEIQSWREKKIEDLSKGMAQKIQFIATVIHEPELLILDEPFSGFDPVNAELIKNEILELRKKGITIVLSTHRMESIELLCDHIAMIHQSKLILSGGLLEVKRKFRKKIYKVILEPYGDLEVPKEWKSITADNQMIFEVPLQEKSPNVLLNEMIAIGEVQGFSEIIPTMEEIFIQQIKSHSYE
ncbi:ATP-binding cassette domain-containing protein [Belliella sp. DSM 107340]|uniref:ATP-binding cassette domain-containing protein n=1 Tax=Belliella calami TaxID=2923436 RepID=A0ABS9UMG8_9BACT|nr:ATP-binding cassette domain-containing protein [Belliella calami]MCH7397605.1 ATP-binding cassette domain-containing protein [Belliella calami]